MSTGVETLACYVPALVLRRLASENERSEPGPERIEGAVLFSDVSGFTALAEQLSREGPAGAEKLGAILNDYFTRLIGLVHEHGGDVLKLAGDALVAFWPSGEESLATVTRRAVACGRAVKSALGEGELREGISLATKVGIGVGEVLAMHVGGVFDRCELLIAGNPLIQMGLAETQAKPGEVVVSPEAWDLIAGASVGVQLPRGGVRVDSIGEALAPRPLLRPMPPPEASAGLRGYVPGAIRARLDAGQTGWLSELRRVTVLFVGLPELNREGASSPERIQEVVRAIQSSLYRYEGSINKLSVDEKGIALLAALGLPPLAHKDDAARALEAALAIREALEALGVRCTIGLATGRVYCGEVGAPSRREYSLFGDTVNLAARLMQAAAGGILCDEATRQAARSRIDFEALPPAKIKGKVDPVPVFRPIGRASLSGETSPLIGRSKERERLAACLETLRDGSGGVAVLLGEAGIGKSRLVADWVALARERGVEALVGAGDSVERSTPYFAWRPIVTRLLGLSEADDSEDRRQRVLDHLADDPEAMRRAPLLNAILPLDLPENETTSAMTGQVRADNTQDLVLGLLREAVRKGPTAVVIEDAHWLDSASWSLLLQAVQRVEPLLLVLATRPLAEPVPLAYRTLSGRSDALLLRLDTLPAEETLALACRRLGVETLPEPAAKLIVSKAQGHPFFTEELALALRDSGLIEVAGGACRVAPGIDWNAVPFPDSIEGIITERIDRLSPSQQLALKVASVVGRVFAMRIVCDIYPIDPEKPELPAILDALERREMTRLEMSDPDIAYIFRHIITQEVAYGLILFAQRRQLHGHVAAWYERAHDRDIATHSPLLAHHWASAGEYAKAIDYLDQAGEEALRGGAYQEAIRFLSEAIDLHAREARSEESADRLRQARWEERIAQAHLALGHMTECREHSHRSLRLLGRPAAASRPRLVLHFARELPRQAVHRFRHGKPGRRSGESDEALLLASSAYDLISQLCYYTQDLAEGVYGALTSLNLAERLGPSPELARSYATMCVAAGLVPFHPLAQDYDRRAHKTADAIADIVAKAWVCELTGIYWLGVGRWDRAREVLNHAVEVNHELGDWRRWEESIGELARLDYLCGDIEGAEAQFALMSRVAQERGHDQARIWSRHGRAKCLIRLGRLDEAAVLLEGSPAVLDESVSRADAILGLGLLALTRQIQGQTEAARHAAERSLSRIGESPLTVNYNLEGYAGTSRVFLDLWESSLEQASEVDDEARRCALRACKALERFAHIFPIAGPRASLSRGRAHWLSGRPRLAIRTWRSGLEQARKLTMPLDCAWLEAELERHNEAPGSRPRVVT